MKITVRKMRLENFKCFQDKEIVFSDKTVIKGRNGVGKSTIYSALMWLLFDKSVDGRSAEDIRPHDKNGVDIDHVDIKVTAVFDVDGREIVLEKCQNQNWVKDRSTKEETLKGNTNFFSVNGIPKKQAEYKAYINENFCSEDVFMSCTNAAIFFRQDTKKRRNTLLRLAKGIEDGDILAEDERFMELEKPLQDGTVDELMARCKTRINDFDKALKAYPIRIEEQRRMIVPIDLSALELERNGLKERMAQFESQLQEAGEKKLSGKIADLMIQKANYEDKAARVLAKEKETIEAEISEKEKDMKWLKSKISMTEQEIDSWEDKKKRAEDEINKKSEEYKETQQRTFNEADAVCQLCGQILPPDKMQSMKDGFEAGKKAEVNQLFEERDSLRNRIKQMDGFLLEARARLDNEREVLEDMADGLDELKNKLKVLPKEPVRIADAEYRKIIDELSKVKAEKEAMNERIRNNAMVELEIERIKEELGRVEKYFLKADQNDVIEERIIDLQKEQRDTAEKMAEEERLLYLLEQLNSRKMEKLTETVNGNFERVVWRLFETMENGGVKDVCYATVNGTNYEKGLNHGDRILADLDMLSTFQKMNGVQLPIFLDDMESVDEWRVPEVDGQLVMIRRTDDKELTVE